MKSVGIMKGDTFEQEDYVSEDSFELDQLEILGMNSNHSSSELSIEPSDNDENSYGHDWNDHPLENLDQPKEEVCLSSFSGASIKEKEDNSKIIDI